MGEEGSTDRQDAVSFGGEKYMQGKTLRSEGLENLLGDSHDTKFNVVKELKTSLDVFPKLWFEPRPLQLAKLQ